MRFRSTRLATVFATFVLLAVILMPGDDVPKLEIPGLDKIVHVLLFACWCLALRFDWEAFRQRPWLLVVLVALAGPASEALQLFAPGRSFDPLDMVADLVGGIAAAAFGAPLVRLADRLLGAEIVGPDKP